MPSIAIPEQAWVGYQALGSMQFVQAYGAIVTELGIIHSKGASSRQCL